VHNLRFCLDKDYRGGFVEEWFTKIIGKPLNLKAPKTYNEKIQWLKVNDSTRKKARLADKYLVRKWIEKKLGKKYLTDLYGCWMKFEDIDFAKLPDKFVLKCNHGCGYNIIVTDKSQFDIYDAREKINNWMSEDYGLNAYELYYSLIKRRIIAEEYIDTDVSPIEMQAWCFNGQVKFVSYETVKYAEKHCRCVLGCDWKPVDFKISPSNYEDFPEIPKKPDCYEEFLEIATKLSSGFYHVRVDFMFCGEKLIFREMTFTPGSGRSVFKPEDAAIKVGDMMKLPCDKKF